MAYMIYIIILAIPVVAVVLAVKWDRRSGRGYGLAALSALLVVLLVWMSIAFHQADQQLLHSHTDNLDAGVVIAVYGMIFLYLVLALWVGGLTLAGGARRWGWLAGIFVSSFAPIVFWQAAQWYVRMTPNLTSADRPDFLAGFILSLAVPPAIILVYGLTRIVRPTQPLLQPAVATR